MSYTEEDKKRLFALSKSLFELSKKEELTTDLTVLAATAADLRAVIAFNDWRYYRMNEAIVSDFEYDSIFAFLKRIEARDASLQTADSPTLRVSSDLNNDLKGENADGTVTHLSPMLSLENSYNDLDLFEFDKRAKKLLQVDEDVDFAYCVEPKFDGGTIVVRYVGDQLRLSATRGNGAAGEDITANAKVLGTLPLAAEFSRYGIATAELRGEVLMAKAVFERLNEERLKKSEAVFANPRNAATGAIRMKNPAEVAARGLEVFIYQMSYAADKEGKEIDLQSLFPTHSQTIDALAGLGFKTPEDNTARKTCKNISEVVDFCRHWAGVRESYNYEIDGMVIKLDDLALQGRLGYTSHHPRWAAAFKFQAKQATTYLDAIEFQVGRMGAITPVAKIRPVEVAGVQISSVSLHNADLIQKKDLRIGDVVLVERAADVIPQIVQSLAELRTGAEVVVVFPTHCPACETELERPEGEAVWRCPNTEGCPAQQVQKFIHFASKDAMNIDGLGESQIERFYQLGWLKQLSDIYRLDYSKIAALEGMGKRSATNLEKAIEKSKQNPASRLLYAFGVRHIGRTNSRNFVANIDKLQDLATWTAEQMMRLNDIGPKAAEQLTKAFAQYNILAQLDELEALGVNTKTLDEERPKAENPNAPFSGKNVLFTGTLPTLKRDAAEEMARQAGAKVVSSVSKSLHYLIAGEAAGSKLEKAQKLGITVITEAEFLGLLARE